MEGTSITVIPLLDKLISLDIWQASTWTCPHGSIRSQQYRRHISAKYEYRERCLFHRHLKYPLHLLRGLHGTRKNRTREIGEKGKVLRSQYWIGQTIGFGANIQSKANTSFFMPSSHRFSDPSEEENILNHVISEDLIKYGFLYLINILASLIL